MRYTQILTRVYSNMYGELAMYHTLSQAQEHSYVDHTPTSLVLTLWWDSDSNCTLNIGIWGDFCSYLFIYFQIFCNTHFLFVINQCEFKIQEICLCFLPLKGNALRSDKSQRTNVFSWMNPTARIASCEEKAMEIAEERQHGFRTARHTRVL